MFLGVTAILFGMTYTDEERRRIGRAVELRRVDLGWGKEEAARQSGISSITWKRVEDALTVQPVKMRRVEAALNWSIGSIERVARGRDPVVDERASEPSWGDLDDADELWRGFKESTIFAELCRQRGANDEMCRYFIADALALLNSAAAAQSPEPPGVTESDASTADDKDEKKSDQALLERFDFRGVPQVGHQQR